MTTTTVSICMDSKVKADMEAACKELGMNMTTAFTIFAIKMGREHRIPFEVSADPFYSRENMAHLKRSISALNEDHGVVHDLVDIDDE